jgi:Txe/YoeB family toxin of Txe-Axe toxin-antitoxin module
MFMLQMSVLQVIKCVKTNKNVQQYEKLKKKTVGLHLGTCIYILSIKLTAVNEICDEKFSVESISPVYTATIIRNQTQRKIYNIRQKSVTILKYPFHECRKYMTCCWVDLV